MRFYKRKQESTLSTEKATKKKKETQITSKVRIYFLANKRNVHYTDNRMRVQLAKLKTEIVRTVFVVIKDKIYI